MSWNYMQPNAGLLNHVGAGYNALGKGLLNMGQFVNEIPMNQKRLGLLDAEIGKTQNHGGLLGAEWHAKQIENRHLPNSIMAKNNHLNAQAAHLGAQTQNQHIKNQSQYDIDQSNIGENHARQKLIVSQRNAIDNTIRQSLSFENADWQARQLANQAQHLANIQNQMPLYAAQYYQGLSPEERTNFLTKPKEEQEAESAAFAAKYGLELLQQNQNTPAYYKKPGLLNSPSTPGLLWLQQFLQILQNKM